MITLLGGMFADDAAIRRALHASVYTLGSKQTATGAIPNNVDGVSLKPNFRAYADGGLWWIIGNSVVGPDHAAIAKALDWYRCQDVDQSGLLSMQESSDWQDLFCTRGKGLYLNGLYVLALQKTGRVSDAAAVRAKVNEYFWYRGDGNLLPHIRHTFSTESLEEQDSLGRRRWLPFKYSLIEEPYYLPWLGFRACGEWFDSLGHLMAILAGIPDARQTATILDFFRRHELAKSPTKAIYPAIRSGSPDWREYYGMLNLPGQYHNGGVWPFIGGFHVAALVHTGHLDQAEELLQRLAELNRAGQFNEWHHGETGEALGVSDQAWSAGMYLFAYECVRQRRVPLLFD